PAPTTTMSTSGSMTLPYGSSAPSVRRPARMCGLPADEVYRRFSRMPDTVPHVSNDDLARFAEAIRSRRSVDLFEPDPPGTARLLEAIELARWAPNHRLTQPWRFYVLGRQTG